MFFTPHVLVGALIGQLTGNIGLAVLGGFISHFVLDIIPHSDVSAFVKTDPTLKTVKAIEVYVAIIDVLIGASIVLSLADIRTPMIAGAVFAILPDGLDNIPWWNQWLRTKPWFQWLHRLHQRFDGSLHLERSRSLRLLGVVNQVVTTLTALWLLLKLS